MQRIVTIILSFTLLCVVPVTQAYTLSSSTASVSGTEPTPIDLTDWSVTDPDANTEDSVRVTTVDLLPDEEFIEVITDSSITASYSNTPLTTGTLEFKAKHNKSGLFYIYAQTSDNGGQLLFSVQFTESNGILLEESDRQITLLSDYTENEWYIFTIDFDNTRGTRGMFRVSLNGEYSGEYEYVKSESSTFDLAQITIGAESTGETSVSGFTDSFSTMLATPSSASDALLLLSISLSSTSISSNLENGLIVTATLDGIASVATSSVLEIGTSTETVPSSTVGSSTEPSEDTTLGSFIMDIVESVIEIFIPEESQPTELPTETLPPEATSTESLPIEETVENQETTEPAPAEPTPEVLTPEASTEETPPISEVQSLTTDETEPNEITTTTF